MSKKTDTLPPTMRLIALLTEPLREEECPLAEAAIKLALIRWSRKNRDGVNYWASFERPQCIDPTHGEELYQLNGVIWFDNELRPDDTEILRVSGDEDGLVVRTTEDAEREIVNLPISWPPAT